MLRANRGQIEIEAHLKVSSRFCYATDHPREEVEKPGYFAPLHDWFARGDILRVVVERDGAMAICEFAVVRSTREDVRLQRIGDWLEIGDGKESAGGLKAEWGGPSHRYRVVTADGAVVAHGLGKDRARAIAAGREPAPGPEAA